MSEPVKKRILLVEDEVLLAMNEKMQLEKYGYSVHHVTTGEKAVQTITDNAHPVDLILMDIDLGSGIDGTQAAEQILHHKDIPVVFLSSHTEPEIVEKTEKITSYGYVVKNSNITVLDASIKMAFKLFEAKEGVKNHQNMLSDINRIGRLANSTLELEAVLKFILEQTVQSLGTSEGMIFLNNPKSRTLTWGASVGLSQAFFDEFSGNPIRMGEGLTGRIAETGEPIFIPENSSHDSRTERAVVHREAFESFIGVPIFADDRVVGVMNILTRFPSRLTEDNVDFCSAIGVQVGSAINNARMYTQRGRIAEELIEAQTKAIESEAKWRSYIENAPDGVFVTDENGKYIEVNKAACRITGYSEDELLGLSVLSLLQEEYLEMAANHFQTVAEEGFARAEVGFVTKSGERRFWNVDAVKLSETRYLGFAKDTTERRQSEEELRRANHELLKAKERAQATEEQTRYILKHNPNAIAVFDNDMNIVMVSDRFLEDYNVEIDDVIGKNHYEVFPELPEGWRDAHRRALQGEILSNDDDYFVRPDGSITYKRWECRPWYKSDQSIGGMIAYTEVITERKQMENALKETVTKYNDLVALIPVGVYVVWMRTNGSIEFEYVSDRWCEIHGLRREDVMNDAATVTDLVYPDDQESFLRLNREAALEQKPFKWEGRFFTGDGDQRQLRIESTPVVRANGDIRWFGVTQDITDRTYAEEKYQSLFNYSNDAIFVHEIGETGLPGRIIEVNDQACRLTQYSREELLQMSMKDITSETNLSAMPQRAKKLIEEKHLTFEAEDVRRDGSHIPVEVSAFSYNEGGRDFVVSSVRDISERKQSEQELTNQKQYLETILETTSDGFWVVTPDRKITNANTAYCRMSGYSTDELARMEINDLEVIENPGETAERMERIMQNGSETFETKHRRKDGSVFDVEVSASRLDHADRVVLIGFCRDITERKNAEHALKESENSLSLIVNKSPFPVAIADLNNEKILYWSHRAKNTFGHLPSTVSEWYELAYPDPEYRKQTIERWKTYLENIWESDFAVNTGEYHITCKDGSLKICEIYAQYIQNNIVVTFNDITERKQAEEEIQKQLSEKETLLREGHHRVINNIATIESLLSLQIGDSASPEVKSALRSAVSRVQSIRVLYDKLLVSKDVDEVLINEYVEDIIHALVMVFEPEKKITVNTHIADFRVESRTAGSIGIIVNELLTNVFKYAFRDRDNGQVSLSITKEMGRVTLIIHDNGIGIDERIMETKSPGFGLTVVKMLTEQLDGTISFKNENGTHTTMKFPIAGEE